MAEVANVNLRYKMVYGAIAGVVATIVLFSLRLLTLAINLGTFDPLDFSSQTYLGTPAGNPNLIGVVIIDFVAAPLLGLVFGIILYLLMTRAGWERNLTRYLIVALVFWGLVYIIEIIAVTTSGIEYDLLIDGTIQTISAVIVSQILGLTVYYLEERLESAS
ncbi:MAG: hypothetical protein ACXAC6_16255 [Candidatus Hodarchaeales archaeon]|jgi:uncharacterized protein (DUF486 family)